MRQNLPLSGFRVVDYSHFLAGPYAGRCLAALGAEVIKVERPTEGDAGRQHAYFIGDHSGYLQQNMGKKGLCVNIVEQEHPALGKIKLPNLPFHFSDCDTTVTRVAPDLGQHNAEVAAGLGFSEAAIAAMQADGVLYSAKEI
jgi:crotonobetainyl-CoA:carnitine CoA-transferase CaiB-like acyl-CoA transferase